MKNTMRCLGIIALAAIIGFSFAACGDGDGGDSNSATYTGYDSSGAEYKLVIEKGSGGNTGGNTGGGGGGGGGGGNSSLNGTWVSDESGEVWVLNNGNLTVSEYGDEFLRGTYTTIGSNITITFTQIKGSVFGEDAAGIGLSTSQWYTKSQLRTAVINYYAGPFGYSQSEAAIYADTVLEDIYAFYEPMTGPYSLSGNTLTIDDDTFTRQGGRSVAVNVSLSSPDDRAAFRPNEGDNYKLTISGSSTSTGIVISFGNNTITLEHTDGVFTVTISGKYIISFSDDIPLDSGSSYTNPGDLTPRKPGGTGGGGGGGGGGSGKGGTFTLTDIPSEYNGKYMFITFKDGAGDALCWGNTESDLPGTFVLSISNGRASIPLWTGADDGVGFQRYTGTETASCECDILGSPLGNPLIHFEFYSISFTNGNATKSWKDIDKFGY